MADNYARSAVRLSALALIEAAGFDVAQQSCVEILTDLLLKYIKEVGAGSHHYAELAGRSETNPVDVALALNDMSTSIADLQDFVRHSQEVPFEHSISSFPVRKQSRPAPTFMERGEVPPPHIPPWLPALPDKHTFIATPVYAGHEKDPQKQQALLTDQRQQAETAAVRLQARLAAASNQLLAAKLEDAAGDGRGAEAGHELRAGDGPQGARQGSEAGALAGNPFLAAPWGELAGSEQEQQEQRQAGGVLGAAQAQARGEQDVSAGPQQGPRGEWEAAALEPSGHSGGFVAQQLFATRDWKAQQQRKARIATSGRVVREAFGEAHDQQAALRLGKRHKRSGAAATAAAAAAAGASDPLRARVEGILAAVQPAVAAPAAHQDLMQEEI